MGQRFVDPEEHQPDAHTRRKQHGKPAGISEIRLGVRSADANLAQRRYDQAQAKQDEDIGGQNEEPSQIAGQEAKNGVVDRRNRILQCQGEYDEQQYHE